MKRKTILFTGILSIFLMLMIPNISAIEYHKIMQENESYLMNKYFKISEIDNTKFIEKNINKEELKDKIIQQFNKYEGLIQYKSNIIQILDSDKVFQIVVSGIIIPVIIFEFSAQLNNLMPNPLTFILITFFGSILNTYFIINAAEVIEDESNFSKWEVYGYLILIDVVISILLGELLTKPNKTLI